MSNRYKDANTPTHNIYKPHNTQHTSATNSKRHAPLWVRPSCVYERIIAQQCRLLCGMSRFGTMTTRTPRTCPYSAQRHRGHIRTLHRHRRRTAEK